MKPATVIGVAAPFDPRLDALGAYSRDRAMNIVRMTARTLEPIELPDGKPVVYVASQLVDGPASADSVAAEFVQAGVKAIVLAADTWFYPGRTAMALTAHFKDVPICCVGGNNAPVPGVVGIDAVVGAYAQTGILCPCVIGEMPETGVDPEYEAGTKAEIVDLVWAMAAAAWMRGKRVYCSDTDSMQMETALLEVHGTRRVFGLESYRDSMKLVGDMIRKDGGYNPAELEELYHWVTEVEWKGRIYPNVEAICEQRLPIYTESEHHPPQPLTEAHIAKLREELKLYLILRNLMEETNCIGGGWTSQLAWGSDPRGLPMACADIAETLFCSKRDHRGPKRVTPFATERDGKGLVTMTCYAALTGGLEDILFADFRKVYMPAEIVKKAAELGIILDPAALYMKYGCVDMDNSGSGALGYAARAFLFEVFKHYFPGGGFSVGYISPGGIECMAGRLGYFDPAGTFTMIQAEAVSVDLPDPIAEAFAHASSYSWPHTWLVFLGLLASVVKYGCPANHIHMVRNLPRRRWQWFSDFTKVLNYRWPNQPEFTEGVDRPEPMIYRVAGGETNYKLRFGGK